MSNPRNAWPLLLALVVAGCYTPPRPREAHVPDWEDVEFGTVAVAPAPVLAPAPEPSAPLGPVTPPPASAPAEPQFAGTWIPLYGWCRLNALPAPVRVAGASAPTYRLQTPNGTFAVRAGSQVAAWDGSEVRLGFSPQLIQGQPYLHILDLRKTVQPLLQGGAGLSAGATPVLVLDPGHGGLNAGTRSALSGHYEKEYTLDWALRLRDALVAHGWQVFLTRTNDSDLALSNRVAFASERKADLFLSLHFNSAAPNQSEAGLETYCLTPAGMPSNLTRGFDDDAAQVFPNNAYDAQNLQLALQVHRALLQINGHNDRGVRRARFPGVLRGQQRPAILIEGGYLSNPREARLIADTGYRQKLADAVAEGLMKGMHRPMLEARNQSASNPAAPASVLRPAPLAPTSAAP